MRKSFIIICTILLFYACEKHETNQVKPYFVAKTNSVQFNTAQLKEKIEKLPMIGKILDAAIPLETVMVDAITYNTKTPDGKDVVASGIVMYPTDITPKGLIAGLHYTITSAAEAPSVRMYAAESLFGLLGYVVIMPDYIGFGATGDKIHPYVHLESTGNVSADMVMAAKEYFKTINYALPTEKMNVVGYSQGGESVLAFQKVVERDYPEIEIIHTYSGGGPLDLNTTYNILCETNYTAYPCSVPYISIGLNYGDNLDLNFSNIFKEPLLSSYPEWYNSKKYNSTAINDFIGSTKISDFMNNDMFSPDENADLKKLRSSLTKNSLIDWTPKAPITLFHGSKDTYVPVENSRNAYASFKNKGCNVDYIEKEGLGHLDAAPVFYLYVMDKISKQK